jgi:hypothetical protein
MLLKTTEKTVARYGLQWLFVNALVFLLPSISVPSLLSLFSISSFLPGAHLQDVILATVYIAFGASFLFSYVTHDMSNGGDLALLSTADWAAIQLVSNWLKTFRLATTEMSTTKKPMLSSTRDTFVTLQSDLKNIIKDLPASVDPELLDGLMNAHLKLSQYFAKCDVSPYGLWACCESSICSVYFIDLLLTLLILLAVLDPRITYEALRQETDPAEGDTLNESTEKKSRLAELEHSKSALRECFLSRYTSSTSFDDNSDPAPTPSTLSGSPQKARTNDRRRSRANRGTTSSTSELDQFFALSAIRIEVWESDPLEWWYNHRQEFPKLYRMVRDILSIPGDNVSSFALVHSHSV